MDGTREVVKGTLRDRYWTLNGREDPTSLFMYSTRSPGIDNPHYLETDLIRFTRIDVCKVSSALGDCLSCTVRLDRC